jgi:DNA-binding winged helix-turn-helix (wHTH) protein
MSYDKFWGRKKEGPKDDDHSWVTGEGVVAIQEKNESSLLLFRPPIRFDQFELDTGSGQLRRSGLPVDLSPQALRVLVMLAEQPGELVARKEIKEALWPGQSYGDFDGRLNFAVRKLRKALGDDAEQPRYVQTVRNAGYRFIAPLQEPQPAPSVLRSRVDHSEPNQGDSLPELTQEALSARKGLRVGINGSFLALVAVVIVVVAVIAALALRQRGLGQSDFYGVRVQPASGKAEFGPEIVSVTPIRSQPRQRIAIEGRGFGLHVPYAHTDSPYLAIRDKTADWSAGRMIPQNSDEVMVDVESWTDTEIVLSGFSGDYGRNSWKLNPGDVVEVAVWNPQSGVGPALYHVAVRADAP